jgi:hypothetical protein
MSASQTISPPAPAPEVAKATIELDVTDAVWFARALLAGASTDDVTPVICASQITITRGRVEGTSTDRYRVHTVFIEDDSIKGDSKFLIPAGALQWIVKNATYFGRAGSFDGPKLTIAVMPGAPVGAVELTMRRAVDSRVISYTDELVKGNFPPVYRLFDAAEKAEVTPDRETAINLEFLSKARNIARDRHEPAALKYTATDNSNKPGPLLVSFRSGRALIQPNLKAQVAR